MDRCQKNPTSLFEFGNTSRQQNEFAEIAAKNFSGLPEGVSRWDVLSLVKRLHRALKLTTTQIAHLEFLIGYTREQDWCNGSSPIVYLTVGLTAKKRGICERQVLNIERSLNKIGFLCWRDSGNHRRYGQRSSTGKLEVAFGVNLSPLAASFDRLLRLAENRDQRELKWKQEKAKFLHYKRILRERLKSEPDHVASTLAIRILMDLPNRIESKVTITRLTCWNIRILNSIQLFEEPCNELIIQSFDDLTGQKMEPHSCINTLSPSERSNRLTRSYDNESDPFLEPNMNAALDDGKVAVLKDLDFFPNKSILHPSGQHEKLTTTAGFLNSGIEHITLAQILTCSSPMLRDMIRYASKNDAADWDAVIQAATLAAGYLGISKPAWQEACNKLGVSAAASLIVIAERRGSNPKAPINSFGGFIRGCLTKAETGDLHLHKSVFGLLNKTKLDE
ncbi:replication initiation protein RepC [Pseudovibrio sp. POLY-S9]|uniref:replication initiation protein RepC n=1 Tax=Pseudovibrio sp. POLY-S9 TaxID=1576596 RepID=UPI000A4E2934|nr:replication initiation protein RepC [Pseudovibrio sp. POLY-S9]